MCNELELERINALVTPLVKNGQSIHQIYESNRDELMCSEKTLYNYIDACLLDVRNIDLPRKVKYRPRYKKPEFKVDRACRNGRTYKDFQAFMESHPDATVVQMDSVCGNQGGKADGALTYFIVMMDHINSYKRKKLNNRSPYDAFSFYYGEEILEKLACTPVAAENIILKPRLLKK